MKSESIKVGAKSKSQRAQMTLNYRRPENVADCLAICEGNEVAVAALFNRGYTIWLQDRFGRPMFEAGDTQAEIQETFTSAVPGKTKGVSKSAKPEVVIPDRVLTQDEVAKLLAAHGIRSVLIAPQAGK